MPHCFKLARRLSRLRADSRALLACCGLVIAAGCRPGEAVAPGSVETGDAQEATPSDGATASDTATVTDSALAAASTGTTIEPGQSIQSKVNSYPGGTSFRLTAGVHRLQGVTPKSGNSFIGEAGAVLSGAKVLTGWKASGSRWYVGGQTQQNADYVKRTCRPEYPGCYLPEQLWIDGVLQKRQTSQSAVGAGSWYFDYTGDRIYIGTNPSGRTVETSVIPQAFKGSATGVTLRNLTIEKYATGSGKGTIDAKSSWTLEAVDVGHNHGACIRVSGSNIKIRESRVHHCGEQGIGGSAGSGLLVYGNEIDNNNTAGFGQGNGDNRAAGMKVSRTRGMIIRKNNVHHNQAIGLWCDISCVNAIYDSNTVADNARRGIQYEVSYGCDISYNTVRRNAVRESGPSAAGIWVAQSTDCEVHHNTLEDNRNGIVGTDRYRGSGSLGPHLLENLYVHHNSVRQSSGLAGGVNDQHTSHDPYSASANNRWASNTYAGSTSPMFMWTGNKTVTWSQWQAAGHD